MLTDPWRDVRVLSPLPLTRAEQRHARIEALEAAARAWYTLRCVCVGCGGDALLAGVLLQTCAGCGYPFCGTCLTPGADGKCYECETGGTER